MTMRVLPAAGDPDLARAMITLVGQLPGLEPTRAVPDSVALLDTLGALAAGNPADLPEVVLVHEAIGPMPALELVREVAMRFPAVGVVLATADPTAGLYSAAMDAGARGLTAVPLEREELGARLAAAAQWASGVRGHLGLGAAPLETGPTGRLVTVSGAKGGVGATILACQLALAAHLHGPTPDAPATQSGGRGVALVDLDLLGGDVGSYFDVQFRRSVVDLAGLPDISAQVLAEAVFPHETGLSLLIAPAEGERGEEVTEDSTRRLLNAVRARYDTVIVDCGSHTSPAGATAVEAADTALLVATPDVIAVRAVNRTVRMWDRLHIRKPRELLTVVNRHGRTGPVQPQLISRITGTPVATSVIPAGFRELQDAQDSGRIQDLDPRGAVRRAMWALAAEIGLADAAAVAPPGRRKGKRP
ncbi:AAA family ATPase [Streptomyces alkaliphilus]|uniref:AAA family ATPase n=1 Tax=Streptomyces alkaliphilus TaxID=1472722 RepID=UPI00117CD4B8|nr:P-loop NTPase [Streptomyces alkaliphilus]MQS09577.1 P-loop NTPase [Streptomyces alkaliphilus]